MAYFEASHEEIFKGGYLVTTDENRIIVAFIVLLKF